MTALAQFDTSPRWQALALVALLLCSARPAWAGPPFLTDDPGMPAYRHSEFYLFSTFDKASDGEQVAAPAFEYNYTVGKDLFIHSVVPFLDVRPNGGSREYGPGDIELGLKYRFVHESGARPTIAIFPLLELPTGDANAGLGNGRVWGTFPVWLEKSWGFWTADFGGGRAWNSAPGQKDYNFGGWLLTRPVTDRLILGGEVYGQGATADGGEHATFVTFGGYYSPPIRCSGCQVLFDLGHTIAGETHTIGYLGLYWTWGPGGKE